jgi:hypothetical protein
MNRIREVQESIGKGKDEEMEWKNENGTIKNTSMRNRNGKRREQLEIQMKQRLRGEKQFGTRGEDGEGREWLRGGEETRNSKNGGERSRERSKLEDYYEDNK